MTESKELQKVEGGQLPAGAGEIPDMIRWALENDANVEVMERIVALQERVTDRNARMAFFLALATFQETCPEIRKSKTADIATKSGGKYGYSYAPLEEITRTIREPLKTVGLSYGWTVEGAVGSVLDVICILRHIEGHEERSSFPVSTATSAAMSEAQKGGAALTYGKRQSLTSVLGLTTAEEDTDAALRTPGQTITEGEAADLDQKIRESEANRARILEFACVERLEEVQAANLPMLNRLLDEKIAALKAREAK